MDVVSYKTTRYRLVFDVEHNKCGNNGVGMCAGSSGGSHAGSGQIYEKSDSETTANEQESKLPLPTILHNAFPSNIPLLCSTWLQLLSHAHFYDIFYLVRFGCCHWIINRIFDFWREK